MTQAPDSSDLWLEQLGNRFAGLWRAAFERGEPRPRIDELLAGVCPKWHDRAAELLLRIEWEVREQFHDGPLLADYLQFFARHANLLRELAGDAALDSHLIPGYRLIREIGRGGTTVVYLAEEFDPDGKPYRPVALQLLRGSGPELKRDYFDQEFGINLTADIDHPRLVKVYHVGRVNDRTFFTMPYYAGGTLHQRIRDRDRGSLTPREAAAICADIAEVVEQLHRHNVLHLDIKPANVLLDQNGRVYVADFNLSRLMSTAGGAALADRVRGTPPYMAPEQVRRYIGPQCDVYGLGATLYEMLTGRPPFRGSTDEETCRQILNEPVQPPRLANPELDGELERLCLRCLEKKTEHRYGSVADVLHDLRHYLDTGQGPAPLTFWEWFRRTLERKVHFEHGAVWSHITGFWAAYTAVGHAAMFGLLQLGVPGWGYWLWFLAFHFVGWTPIWVKLGLGRRRLDPTERGVMLNWAGAIVADALLLALFCPLAGTPPPEAVARVYPAWMAMHGLMWFMEARAYWGRFYLLGITFFIAAALLPLFGLFAPLAFATVNSVALLWLSATLRFAGWVTRTPKPGV